MNNTISPFLYTNYRDFLRDFLKEKGFTYASFGEKHKEIISSATLAAVLSRGRTGAANRPVRNISPETLARIGKVLKLEDNELTYLLLLKLENDGEAFPGVHGGAYLESMRKLVSSYKAGISSETRTGTRGKTKLTESAATIAEFMDLLPSSTRLKILQRILLEARAFLNRQQNKPGLLTLHKIVNRLENLVQIGAP